MAFSFNETLDDLVMSYTHTVHIAFLDSIYMYTEMKHELYFE